ncbi:L-threonylcarbamoyladenylate synthase [Thauera sp.]|jgi:tRNA threonylcarbamoyl adenosine modification protein (Sua5/YciO/YrdC/YwlC family)|uniref:L-threonylcarbamoyladenylate synthase n=1 Tax=Thauera sp. TaxID=1905334 RepID=UPI002A3592A2|nr:L-threonylcarbamoyladenylate synthase [Thauera sp.]MDX9884780.1 L-threonylcarbamoyladenylate synthase [Thauera sp.]
MAQFFSLHPEQPQARLIRQAAEIIRAGGVVALPTDSAYALACQVGDAALLERVRRIRGVDDRHHFTLLCRDLSEIGTYARVDNTQYRLLKATTPGPYTFILEGTKELPRRVLHPKRKTIGLRVPEHAVVSALLAELDGPLLSATLILPGEDLPMTDADEIRDRLGKVVDLVIEAGYCGPEATTVIDLTSGAPALVRAGRGPLEPFGL